MLCDVVGYGITTDGVTTFINASNVNKRRQPVNKPVIFDLPLPAGVTKWTGFNFITVLYVYTELLWYFIPLIYWACCLCSMGCYVLWWGVVLCLNRGLSLFCISSMLKISSLTEGVTVCLWYFIPLICLACHLHSMGWYVLWWGIVPKSGFIFVLYFFYTGDYSLLTDGITVCRYA